MDTPGNARAMSQLQSVKDALDKVIEPAAPGYRQYLDNYSAASKPIHAQELLQGYRPSLLGADGTMQLSRVNAMMKSIGGKMASDGVNPAKSLTDDDVGALFDLRSDLLRQNNRNLARPTTGSDTSHNLLTAGEMGLNAATAGAHVLASHVPGANMLLDATMGNAAAANSAKAKAYWTKNLLTPPMRGSQ